MEFPTGYYIASGLSPAFSRIELGCAMVFSVFGYGSLIWNPGFDYDEKILGYIKDYRSVFDLACIDHRGTPNHPVRTCTLEKDEGSICWGVAYCVRGGSKKERLAMEYLERRECEYDKKTLVDFYKEGNPLRPTLKGVVIFTNTPDKVSNKYYLGPAPLKDMAKQIAIAFGPCGNNREYLFRLETALLDIGLEDDYVMELTGEVRRVLKKVEKKFIGTVNVNVPTIQLQVLQPRQEAIAME